MPSRVTQLDSDQIVADLLKDKRRMARALTEVQVPQPAKDTFTVAASPATTYQLNAIPYQGSGGSSLNLSLNGLELVEGVDYTCDYTTAIVTVTATLTGTPTPADVLTADYWTSGDLIALTGPIDTGATYSTSATYSGSTASVSSAPITIPTVNAGDLMLYFPSVAVGSGTTTITGPAGWTQQVASTQAGPTAGNDNGVAAGLWSKVATGTEGGSAVSATFSTANRATAVLLIYSAATISTVASSSGATTAFSYTAPTPAASVGKICVYFFAKSANNTGQITVGSPATQRAQSGDTGYDDTAAGDAVATGSTAPSVSGTVPGPGTPGPSWVAATVVL